MKKESQFLVILLKNWEISSGAGEARPNYSENQGPRPTFGGCQHLKGKILYKKAIEF